MYMTFVLLGRKGRSIRSDVSEEKTENIGLQKYRKPRLPNKRKDVIHTNIVVHDARCSRNLKPRSPANVQTKDYDLKNNQISIYGPQRYKDNSFPTKSIKASCFYIPISHQNSFKQFLDYLAGTANQYPSDRIQPMVLDAQLSL